MIWSIEAGKELEESLKEFDLLLRLAEMAEAEGEVQQYTVFLKCALLLLTTKFECFLEELVEEVSNMIRTENVRCSLLPPEVSTHYTYRRHHNLESQYNSAKFQDIRSNSVELARFWLDQGSADFEIDCKFSYGKHGEKELARLLRRIGICEPFSTVKVEKEMPDGSTQIVDMVGIINSLIAIRNNVLHQNASPSLTRVSLLDQHACLLQFCKRLVLYVESRFSALLSDDSYYI